MMRCWGRAAAVTFLLAFACSACSGGGTAQDEDALTQSDEGVIAELPNDPEGPLFGGEGEVAGEDDLCGQYAAEIELLGAQLAILQEEHAAVQTENETACSVRTCDVEESCRTYIDRVEKEVQPALDRCRERMAEKTEERDGLRSREGAHHEIIAAMVKSGSRAVGMDCSRGGYCIPTGSRWEEAYWQVEGAVDVYWRAHQECERTLSSVQSEYADIFVLPEATPTLEMQPLVRPAGGMAEIVVDEGGDHPVADAVVILDEGGSCPDLFAQRTALRTQVEALRAEVEHLRVRTAHCNQTFKQECSRAAMICDPYKQWLVDFKRQEHACRDQVDLLIGEIAAIEKQYDQWQHGDFAEALKGAVGDCKRLSERTHQLIEQRFIVLPPVAEAERMEVFGPLGDGDADAPSRNLFCDEGEVVVGLHARVKDDDIAAIKPICQPWRSGVGLDGESLPLPAMAGGEDGTLETLRCPEGFALQHIRGSWSHGRIGSIAGECVRVDGRGIVRVGSKNDSVPMTVHINDRAEGLATLGTYWDEGFAGERPHDQRDVASMLHVMDSHFCHAQGVARGISVRADDWVRSINFFCDSFERGERAMTQSYFPMPFAVDSEHASFWATGPAEGIYNGVQYQEITNFVGKARVDDMTTEDEGTTASEYVAAAEEDLGVGTLVMTGVSLSYHDDTLDFITPVFNRVQSLHVRGRTAGYVPSDEGGINTDAGTRDDTDLLQCPQGYVVTGLASTAGRRMVMLRCAPVVDGGRVAHELSLWGRRWSRRKATPNVWEYQLLLCDRENGVATGLKGRSQNKVVNMKLECGVLPEASVDTRDRWASDPNLFADIVPPPAIDTTTD